MCALSSVAVVVAACSGGSTPPSSPPGNGLGGSTATPTARPSGAPSASPTPSGGSVLVVGPGRPYTTVASAVAAAQDGDTIDVIAGTYTNDFSDIQSNITIVGVGGMVHMVATVPPPNEKSIFVVEKGLTIENFEISGVAIPASEGNNGAGIRLDAGNLTVEYCYIHNNQDGILGGVPGNVVSIDHSEFYQNGAGDGQSHNLYIGPVASFTFSNSYSHGALVGHELKSRATMTSISNSVIADGPTGTASYDVDLPDGGVASISDSQLEKGPDAQNETVVHYMGENPPPGPYASNSLTLTGNTIINDLGANAKVVVDVAIGGQPQITAMLGGNSFYGWSTSQVIASGSQGDVESSNQFFPLADAPPLDTTPPWQSAPIIPIPPG
ncbi:MAG: hypothetical protein ACREM8_11295 [Vulcanimicrobiaceae bacterium]